MENNPTENFEFALATKALKMDTLSKLTYSDHQKFEAIVNDIFREIPRNVPDSNKLRVALEESCKELGFYVNDKQVFAGVLFNKR